MPEKNRMPIILLQSTLLTVSEDHSPLVAYKRLSLVARGYAIRAHSTWQSTLLVYYSLSRLVYDISLFAKISRIVFAIMRQRFLRKRYKFVARTHGAR